MMSQNHLVQLDEILSARCQTGDKIHHTPTVRSTLLSEIIHANVLLKLELFQKTGSFKVRGITNKIASLSEEERQRGVVSLSAGNAAQAVAWSASQYNTPAILVMPQHSVLSKQEATRSYGGNVVLTSDDLLK